MKVGDKVRVARKYIPDDNFYWLDKMDNYIGNIYDIKDISEDGKRFNLGSWWFPAESLELVTESFNIIPDSIGKPLHYTTGEIECIDAIRSALTEEEFRGYCKGNVLKYTWRERMKGQDEDLKKAGVYLSWLTTTQKQ